MIYQRCITFLFIFFSLSELAFGQKINLSKLEKSAKAAISKCYPASVRIWGFDTVKKIQTSSQFSGVVVTAEGHILTVSHAIIPKQSYKVLFPDGREVMAKALGRVGFSDMQNRPDIGMMKITTNGNWPVAEMGYSNSLKENEPCLSISYPETLNQRLPSVRFGYITHVQNQFGFVQSTAKMEPGDSGGPLYDFLGRVIAMHSRCGESENENYEVPVDLYRKYWKALQQPIDYKVLPTDTQTINVDLLRNEISASLEMPKLNSVSTPAKAMGTSLQLNSNRGDFKSLVLATIILSKGRYHVISKSSMVFNNPKVCYEGQYLDATILKRDMDNDLVLLRLNDKLKNAILIAAIGSKEVFRTENIGNFLVSILPLENRVSILGSIPFEQPRKFSAGYLGAPARFTNEIIELRNPIAGSPAQVAGLRAGDRVTQINDVLIAKAADYGIELVKYNPGDTVTVQGKRTGSAFSYKIVLGRRPVGTHLADQFRGGKSIRLDGFKKVFSHDTILKPDECGSPVFDIQGNFYGINIARFSRTTTLVLPANVVRRFIDPVIR